MAATVETILERVLVQLAELKQENVELRAKVSSVEGRSLPPQREQQVNSITRTSRRSLLKTALGVTAATVGTGALLQTHVGAAQAAATFKQSASGAGNTAIEGDGTSSATGVSGTSDTGTGGFFSSSLANSNATGVTAFAYVAVNAQGTSIGVQGYSNLGTGALGSTINGTGTQGESTTGTGVLGHSVSGTGIAGSTDSPAVNAVAIIGTITSPAPGTDSAAVSGVNNGINANGSGVVGSHAGGGTGVAGSSSNGIGGSFAGGTGTGVQATGAMGVIAVGTSGPGIKSQSTSNYGGDFAGGRAPIVLRAAPTAGAPTTGSHNTGELYVAATGKLFFCVESGTPGTWKQVKLI
jgi:hypothetical protein